MQKSAQPTSSTTDGSNLTVNNVTVTGILDFEKTAYGHPLFDIARSLAFLLIDCKYKDAAKIRKYFLQSGYAKRGQTTLPLINLHTRDTSVSLLEQLIDLFLLHDFYKFLLHNPYESLARNEHYQRTEQLLLERGLIRSVGEC